MGVTIQHMHAVISSSRQQKTCQALPLQQRVAACTLLRMVNATKKPPTLGQFYDSYVAVCRERKLAGVSEAEFVGAVDMLEVRGVVAVKRSRKSSRLWTVTLRRDSEELSRDLEDNSLLTSLLQP